MDIKQILKTLKLHESTASMVLGALVIVVVGFLVVGYFRNLDTGTTLPTGAENEKEEQRTHVVKEGESLWKIAEANYGSGYNWVDIAQANDLQNPNNIEKGQELVLPNLVKKQPENSSNEIAENESTMSENNNLDIQADTKITQTPETISDATYTVVRGDNLWNIAVRAYGDGYKWVEIARENKLANPNLIHAGNVLVLPR